MKFFIRFKKYIILYIRWFPYQSNTYKITLVILPQYEEPNHKMNLEYTF